MDPNQDEADQLFLLRRRRGRVVGKQPVSVDQLRRLVVDQRHAADLARPLGMDDVVVDRREVDDLRKGVADLVQTVVQPEQADFVSADLGSDGASQRQDCLAELDPELPCSVVDRRCGNLFDAVDDGEAQRAAAAIEPTEKEHRRRP